MTVSSAPWTPSRRQDEADFTMTSTHYGAVSSDYEDMFAFRTQYQSAFIDDVIGQISQNNMSVRDMVLADIGCGTGALLKSLSEKETMKKFLAVEPCRSMLEELQDGGRTPIEKYCMDGNEFAKMEHVSYDVSVMFAMIHHIPPEQLLDFLRGIFTQTRPGGSALIITYSPTLPFPLWPEHVEAATACFPTWDILQDLLRQAGFDNVTCVRKSYGDVVLPRDRWLRMVRNRFISTLASFSDEEIEEGIRTMEYPDPVVYEEWQYFIKASKLA